MKISFDYKWFLTIVATLLTMYFTYNQFQVMQKEYELKINPILDIKFNIQGVEKCDLVLANNGVIAIKDIQINLWPRIVGASGFHMVSTVYGKIPWKTINNLDPRKSLELSVKEGLQRARRDYNTYPENQKITDRLLPILLVYVTYHRPSDNRKYYRYKYILVGEDSIKKDIVPFDLDEMPRYINLKESLMSIDKKMLECEK